MLKTSSRTFLLRYLPPLVVILVDVFFLVMLDSYFFNAKRVLITDTIEKFNPLLLEVDPIRIAASNLVDRSKNYTEEIQSYLKKEGMELIKKENPWYRIVLDDGEGHVVYEIKNMDKYHRYNNWKNCLFSQNFSAPVGNIKIRLTLYYVTPMGWDEIESMVMKFRIYAVLFIIGSWVICYLLSRNVFKPLIHVHEGIEKVIRSDRVALIPGPRHETETAFNQLVRTQREVLFGLEIDRIVDDLHTVPDDSEVIQRFFQMVPESMEKIYPISNVEGVIDTQNGLERQDGKDEDNVHEICLQEASCLSIPLRYGKERIGLLRCGVETAQRLVDDEVRLMGQEIQKQLENGIVRCISRSRSLTEERNRFGINLATNMGHDLTNIIASGKWDMDTILRAQSMGIISLDSDRGQFFTDAVQGLRNHLSFLQEMVDIYRSFGYTRRPRFEEIDLSALAKEITHLFSLSTSKKITTKVQADETVRMTAEPRLLRMAFFNLLVNAAQAISQAEPPVAQGEIVLAVSLEQPGAVNVTVRDNGPGIRSKEGTLLSPNEVNRIFQSGYSTKGKDSGGGLGLSWVRSIVEDFHNGEITASNRKEGGAQFTITLPFIQAEEDA